MPHRVAPGPQTEREMREAEDLALAASGLGSGLLKRQPMPEDDSVAVLKVCPHCGTEYETAARFCPADGTSLRPKGSDSLIDRVLAERYHILKRIGEGGMGRVYLGEHVKMNRQCAIKVMNPALVNDHESATRFAREASSAARIIHPNVAAVFDFGESEGLVYLVMEFVDGEPLSRILAREAPLSVDRAIDLTLQIADGLGAAHELGIIHRDLKPDNILVARTRAGKEVAKVVDFGIAKAMQETVGEALTRTGLVIGTPEFMSPEQLLGDPIDARSDLYALGCILHLMLTAVPPFEAPTREQMIKRRLAESAPHVQSIDPTLPTSLDRIVERLLARDPAERYGSSAEVRDALRGTHPRSSGGHDAVRSSRMDHTPRSAPTVAFNALQNATTEVSVRTPSETPGAVTEVRAPGGRARVVVAGAAGVGVLLLLARLATSPASPPPAGPQPSRSRDSASARVPAAPTRAAPAPAAGGIRKGGGSKAGSPLVTPPVPSRAEAQRAQEDRARRRIQDSIVRVESGVPRIVRATITSYARAIETRDLGQLKTAYPSISGQQLDRWRQFFESADSIHASVLFSRVRQTTTSIDAPFTVRLRFVDKEKHTPTSSRIAYLALFAREGGDWVLKEIR